MPMDWIEEVPLLRALDAPTKAMLRDVGDAQADPARLRSVSSRRPMRAFPA